MTGNAMTNVAIPWFVLQTTGSAAKTALAFGLSGLANVLAAFFGGPVVDRLGFKRCSVLADVASGVSVALIPLLYSTVGISFWQLLALIVVGSILDTPGTTARMSFIPLLAERARMPKERANSVSQAIRQLSDFLGPPLAGILMVVIGAIGVLWLNAFTFAVSAAAIALAVPAIGAPFARVRSAGPRGYVVELLEGLSFLRSDRLLRTITIAAVAFNFLANPLLTVVVVVYAERNFGNPASLGLILGAFAGGVFSPVFSSAPSVTDFPEGLSSPWRR
jgi:MFS family permease